MKKGKVVIEQRGREITVSGADWHPDGAQLKKLYKGAMVTCSKTGCTLRFPSRAAAARCHIDLAFDGVLDVDAIPDTVDFQGDELDKLGDSIE